MGKKLEDCILLTVNPNFEGTLWMTEKGAPVWEGATEDWAEIYQPLIKLFYNIGFIGCVRKRTSEATYSHDEPDFADTLANLREVVAYVVHPAFRPALDIQDAPVFG